MSLNQNRKTAPLLVSLFVATLIVALGAGIYQMPNTLKAEPKLLDAIKCQLFSHVRDNCFDIGGNQFRNS
jgi:hypothetical protein